MVVGTQPRSLWFGIVLGPALYTRASAYLLNKPAARFTQLKQVLTSRMQEFREGPLAPKRTQKYLQKLYISLKLDTVKPISSSFYVKS